MYPSKHCNWSLGELIIFHVGKEDGIAETQKIKENRVTRCYPGTDLVPAKGNFEHVKVRDDPEQGTQFYDHKRIGRSANGKNCSLHGYQLIQKVMLGSSSFRSK